MTNPPPEEKEAAIQPKAIGQAKVGRFRFAIVSLLLIVMAIASADRVNISLLLTNNDFLNLMDLANNPTAQGLLMSAFVLAYGLSNVVLGPMADWLGSRRVLAGMLVLWTGISAFAGGVSSLGLMMFSRGLRGVSEGPVFPTMNRFASNWFPRHERGRANAIWLTGTSIGMALAVPLLSFVISNFGWRASFYGLAGLSLAIGLPLVIVLITDRPEQNHWVKPDEANYIHENNSSLIISGKRRWSDVRLFVGDYHYWLLVAYHGASLSILWGLVTWIPSYLVEARGFDLVQSGMLASLPYLLSGLATLVFGSLSDRFDRQAPFCAIQTIGAAVAIFFAANVSDAMLSLLCLAIGFGLWGVGGAVSHTILQRIVPSNVISTGSGIDNGLSNLAAAACPALIGFTISLTNSYSAGMMVLVALGLISGLFMVILSIQRY